MEQLDAVILGLDVGKTHHHLVAVDRDGTTLLSRTVANTEADLRELIATMQRHGPVVLVVDQPATVGALPVTVARAAGVPVAYLPGLTMRRMADVFPGEAKTDARDALVIAMTARTAPHPLRHLELVGDELASLTMRCGFDADLVQQRIQTMNRVRGLLVHLHPSLERVLGPALDRRGVLELVAKWPTPAALATAGPRRIETFLARRGSRKAVVLASAIAAALTAQTVVVPGTAAAAQVLPRLAAQLLLLKAQRDEIARDIETLVAAHPLAPVLTSLPGVGVRTAAAILITTSGKTFASAAHLAAYAGIAPVTHRSGSSIRGEYASRRGNNLLKDALYQSSFASLRTHAPSRSSYDRKRKEGKRNTQALLALTRRRIDVLYAMLRDGTPYHQPT